MWAPRRELPGTEGAGTAVSRDSLRYQQQRRQEGQKVARNPGEGDSKSTTVDMNGLNHDRPNNGVT